MGVGTRGDHDRGYRVTQRKKKQERTKEEGLVEVEWAGREGGREEGGKEWARESRRRRRHCSFARSCSA